MSRTDDVEPPVVEAGSVPSGRLRTLAISAAAVGVIMDLLDSTIVNIGVPSIRRDLGASYTAAQWLTAGYALTFAVLLVPSGRLGDRYGYRRLFLVGMAAFTISSLASGLAPTTGVLILARLAQGAAASLMVPQVLSMMQVMYAPRERGRVTGLFGALGGFGASVGPVIGGVLIQWDVAGLEWRPVFLINVPLGVFGVVVGLRLLPRATAPSPVALDPLSVLLLVAGLGALIYALIQGRDLGWPAWLIALIPIAVVLTALFVLRQRRLAARGGHPLVVPGLFAIRTFRIGAALNLVFEGVLIGFLFTLTIVLQNGLHLSVIAAALTGIPVSAGIMIGIVVLDPRLVPRIGKWVFPTGTAVLLAGLLLVLVPLQLTRATTSPFALAPGLLLTGIGLGVVMGVLLAVSLQDVRAGDAGSASGTLQAGAQVGGALGIAVIATLLFEVLDRTGDLLGGFTVAMVIVMVLAVVCAVLSIRLPRHIEF